MRLLEAPPPAPMTRTRRATWLPGSGGPAGVAAPVIGADYLRCRANNRQPQRGHLCAYTMTGACRTERIAPTGPTECCAPPGSSRARAKGDRYLLTRRIQRIVRAYERQIRDPPRDPEACEEGVAARRVELRRWRRRDGNEPASKPPVAQPARDPPGHPGRRARDRSVHVAPRRSTLVACRGRSDGRPRLVPPARRPRDGARRHAGGHAPVPLRRVRMVRRRRREGEYGTQDVSALPPRRSELGRGPDRASGGFRVPGGGADRRRAGLRPPRA